MVGDEIISTRKSTDTWSKMGAITNIYYYNSKRITEHGLQPVTLQDDLVMMEFASYCNNKRIIEHGLQPVTLQDDLVMMEFASASASSFSSSSLRYSTLFK